MTTEISGKYEVIGLLGSGGMGVVYKVRHKVFDTIRALKMLPSYLVEDQEMVERLRTEAQVMARLSLPENAPPNIVKVFDFDHDGDRYYLVMQYIQGKTLKEHLEEKGPLLLPEIIDIARQVGSALAYAHNYTPAVIHRDVKPANIMIEEPSGRAIVMDFGIAKDLGDRDRTQAEALIGTVKYCSPEQIRHERLDGRADIYSLGMVLYEMYTGKQFFAGLSNNVVLGKVLHDPQEHEPHFDRPVPEKFAKLVAKAIAKDRERRYQRMEDLLRDLEACKSESEGESYTILMPPPGRRGPRSQPAYEEEVVDVDKRLQELEEEKQRLLVSPLQTQARQAREKAARASAPTRAAALFQAGFAAEKSAQEKTREKQYTQAQDAYREAASLFEQAEQQATAAAIFEEAEQKRKGMETAKVEAERYGARERARTFYGKALALHTQADKFWEQNAFQQASQTYQEANRFFEDARELAYREMLKEEAESARVQALTAKEAAVTEGAEELAPELYQDGNRHEHRASLAAEHDEFTQARELYGAMRQKYAEAKEYAQRERQRRYGLAAQQQTRAAQERADAEEARQYALQAYQQAFDIQRRGDSRFAAHAYEQAALEYQHAQEAYEQATQTAARERKKQAAAAANQLLQKAQTRAMAAGAQTRLAQEFAQAQKIVEQGHKYQDQQDFAQAAHCYEQAEQQFRQLERTAKLLAAQEDADAARQQMKEVRAYEEALKEWARTRWAEAQEWESKADQAYQTQEYEQAAENYRGAYQLYEQARREAEREKLLQEALVAERQARAARKVAEDEEAAQYAAAVFRQANETLAVADQQRQVESFKLAAEQYQLASGLFAQAATEAQQERTKQTVALARQHADAARVAAEQAGAAERSTDEFVRAQHMAAQGQENEARQDFSRAVELYQQATQHFAKLRDEAVLQTAKEQAEAARLRMEELKQRLATLTQWLGANAKWVEAQQWEATARQAWQAGQYGQATEEFTRAGQKYEEASAEAEEARARQHALEAQRQAEQAHDAAHKADAPQYASALYQQAVEEQQQGQHYLTNTQWGDAAVRFVQAAELFTEACRYAQEEKGRQAAQAVSQRAERAQTMAERAGATERFAEEFAQALQVLEQGRNSEAGRDYAQALHSYEQAVQHFARLRRQALLQLAKEDAHAARQQMVDVRERGKALRDWAKTRWQEAQQKETEADDAYQKEVYEQASEIYERARHLYEQAQQEGEREQQYQGVLQIQEQVAAARKDAEGQQAEHYAAARFAQGKATYDTAEEHWRVERFAEAAQAYRQAYNLFTQATTESRRERIKQEVVQAHQQAEDAQAQARQAGAAERLEKEFAQAQRLIKQGKKREDQEEYTQALSAYEQAIQQFLRLRQEVERQVAAEEQKRHEQALAARQQAQQSQMEAAALSQQHASEPFLKAEEIKLRAEQYFAERRWQEASDHFAQAATLFSEALQTALRTQAKLGAEAARKNALAEQQKARATRGAELFRERFVESTALLQKAEQTFADEEFGTAQALFEKATLLFQQLCQDVTFQIQKQGAEQAKAAVSALQARAQTARGRQKRQAERALAAGDHFFEQQQYDAAQASYREAAALFATLIEEAARQATVPSPPKRPRSFPWGYVLSSMVVLALVLWVGFRFLGQGGKDNGLSKQRQLTAAAEQAVRQARTQAKQVGAEQYAGEGFGQGVTAQQQADKARDDQQYERATQLYVQAQSFFDQARTKAEAKVAEQKKQDLDKQRQQLTVAKDATPKSPEPVKSLESELTDADIQSWLENYQQAWGNKDVNELVELGAITSQNASKFQSVFDRYPKGFRVELKNVERHREGKQVKVTFTRVEIFKGVDPKDTLPETFTIEKKTNGRVVGRK